MKCTMTAYKKDDPKDLQKISAKSVRRQEEYLISTKTVNNATNIVSQDNQTGGVSLVLVLNPALSATCSLAWFRYLTSDINDALI